MEALQQAILSGQIPAGTEMTQNELAESLGVSRMPVREALMILEYQGLIIRLPNNHVKAADLNEDALRQILALGAQLERQAMRALPQDAMLAGGEMLQHRTLRTVLSYPLHRKLLESIQETYIAFAVSARPAPVNDRLSRLLMLDRQGSPDVLDAWNTYEEELSASDFNDKESICWDCKPIKLLPARERVASALRKAIISKSIPEGAELTLENTAQELGVSVTPVREAFQILARDGLLEVKQNKCAIVLGVTEKNDSGALPVARCLGRDGVYALLPEQR